jgi:regulator of sigma E protease
MDLLYFVLFVSALITIHELGHFAFAKVFGVKVLTFSVGFGPKLLRLRGKETEYCLGILPFGGFVRMLEEGRGEPILPEERHRTFEAQSLLRRAIIVLAGPAMNVAFPVLLYASVYIEDRAFLPPVVGVVTPGKPADGKLLPGDLIVAVDGVPVTMFPEVQAEIAKKVGVPVSLTIERDGKRLAVEVTPADEAIRLEPPELEMVSHVGRIGISPVFPGPVIGISSPESPAGRAGLRTFDRIVAVNGRKVERFVDLARMLSANRGDNLVVTFERPRPTPVLGGLGELALLEPGVATLTPLGKDTLAPVQTQDDEPTRARDAFARTGIEAADLYVVFVPEGSSEWRAGLRPGDRVVSLDGAPVRQWSAMVAELRKGADAMHTLSWTRNGVSHSGQFQLRREEWMGEMGPQFEYVFHTAHWAPAAPDRMVDNPAPYRYALGRGFEETGHAIRFISVSLLRLVEGRVSLSQVSGPITLYDVAGEAGAKGATYFVWAMAITSVNLGLVNLLPIPVLDGGHLVLFLLEAVRRKPVSVRTRGIVSLVGMAMLMALMAIAFKNDVTRKWGVISAQVHEVFGG